MDEPEPPYVDTGVQEVFATDVAGFFLLAGNVHLTFATRRVSHVTSPGPVARVVTSRLVLPVIGAQGLAAGLYDFLKKHGLDPVPTPPRDEMQ